VRNKPEQAAQDEVPAGASTSSYNTIKPNPRSRTSYAARLTFAFAITALMTVVVLALVLAFVWTGQFQQYTRANMQRAANAMAESLAQQYEAQGGWTIETLQSARNSAESLTGVGVQVLDTSGSKLYDDTNLPQIDTGKGTEPVAEEESVVSADIITSQGINVGSVRFWSMSKDAFFTKSDSAFRTSSYTAIVFAGGATLVLACLIGYFVSRAMTKPLKRITTTARQIRNGNLSARIGIKGTDEIGQLAETFDDMTATLERDIMLEHRLTSDVAHELRTPLMAMQATVEAMQDGVLPCDDEHLATVAIEVRRLSRLVDAMLKLSRMENGKTPIKKERTDVVSMVNGLVLYQAQLFSDNGLDLIFENNTGADEYFAELDADLIREAVVNLMSNAMRYTPEGGSVTVSVGKSRTDVLISVQDTGIGIAKEDIPRVFSRFWRSDASRERVAGGLGVGLSLTKEIIDRHNGTIQVDSEEGVGTTFTLALPVARNREHERHEAARG
jgi:two-component system sensor histidine kinase BaeS